MRTSDQRARSADRACADATEAAVLVGREGELFDAVIVDRTEKGVVVQLVDLPVLTRSRGSGVELGEHVSVRLVRADVAAGALEFEIAGQGGSGS